MPNSGKQDRKPEIRVTDYVTSRLCGAAFKNAKLAMAEEKSKPAGFQTNEPYDDPCVLSVMEFAASAVIMSVAALEGIVNELFAEAVKRSRGEGLGMPVSGERAVVERRWAAMWRRGMSKPGYTIADKLQSLVELSDLEPLPTSRGSLQHLAALVHLRNRLVHAEPVTQKHAPFRPIAERGELEKLLSGKFEPSTLLPITVPFVWARCLSAGCAKWAVETRVAVRNDLYAALGIGSQSTVIWDRK
jgi:hypothetical protein